MEPRRLLAVGFDHIPLPDGDIALQMAGAGDGSLWITASTSTTPALVEILRLDPTTGAMSTVATIPTGTTPIGLEKGPDGSIWMVSATSHGTGLVADYGPGGTRTEALPDAPTSFAFGADGDLYATAQHADADGTQHGEILRLDPAADQVTTFPLDDSGVRLDSMTLGPDGDVWFAEEDPSEIGKIAADGTITTMPFPSPINADQWVTLTPASGDAIWYDETVGGLVFRIDADGTATLIPGLINDLPGRSAPGAQGSTWFVGSQVGQIDASGTVKVYDGAAPSPSATLDDSQAYSSVALIPDGQDGFWYMIPGQPSVGHVLTDLPDPGITLTLPFSVQLGYEDFQGTMSAGYDMGTFTSTDPNATADDFHAYVAHQPATIQSDGGGVFTILSPGLSTYQNPHKLTIDVADALDHDAIGDDATGVDSIGDLSTPYLQNFTAEAGHAHTGYADSVGFFDGDLGSITDSTPHYGWGTSFLIQWGDGTSSIEGTRVDADHFGHIDNDHIYSSPGTYTVTVTAFDVDEAATATCVATILDTPTIVESDYWAQFSGISAIPQEPFQGQVFWFLSDESDAVPADFTAEIDWGDGMSSPGTIVPSGQTYYVYRDPYLTDTNTTAGVMFLVTGSHTYSGQPAGKSTVTIQGIGSYPSRVSDPLAVQVSYPTLDSVNAIPAVANVGQDLQGTIATFYASPVPQDPGDLAATIDYGDGVPVPATVQPDPTSGPGFYDVVADHVFTAKSIYPLTVTILSPRNPDQAPVVVTDDVIVIDPAGVAHSGTLAATEGPSADFTLAEFTPADPQSTTASFSATIDWGDGTTSAGDITAGPAAGQFTIGGNHAFHRGDTLPVSVTLWRTSDGAAIGIFSLSASVTPALITATAQTLAATEGVPFTDGLLATFTSADPGADETSFSATIAWGDGTSSAGTVLGDGSVLDDGTTLRDGVPGLGALGAHTYARGGVYQATTTIMTPDGKPLGTTTSEVDVAYQQPSVTGDPISATTGQAFAGAVASFRTGESGLVAADFTAAIDWGDGSPATPGRVIPGASGAFTVTASHAYSLAGTYPVTVAIGRVGAASSTTTVATTAASVSAPPATVLTPVLPTTPVTVPASPLTPIPESADSSPSSPSSPPAPAPLVEVGGIQVMKKRGSVAEIVVQFSGALDAGRAVDLSAYGLASGTTKRHVTIYTHAVALKSATYDAGMHRVTLTPRKSLAAATLFQLTVRSAVLDDAAGRPIDGDGDGQPGGDFVRAFGSAGISVAEARPSSIRIAGRAIAARGPLHLLRR